MFEIPFLRALNHLLQSEPWARERLAPFAGETLAMQATPLPELRFTIAGGGCLQEAAAGAAATLTVKLKPGALAAAARGEEHLLREVDISGNARLASELMFLARHLRWDAEEDLSKVLGDVMAHRIVGTLRHVAAWHRDAAARLAEGLVEYAVDEKGMLARREELAALALAQAQLRDALDRLEARISRLAAP